MISVQQIPVTFTGEGDERIFFVSTLDGKASGGCSLKAKGRLVAEIIGVHTHPEYFRRGIAFKFVGEAVEAARAAGCEAVSLTVNRTNAAAVALYRKLGFIPSYQYPEGDLMIMSRQINDRR